MRDVPGGLIRVSQSESGLIVWTVVTPQHVLRDPPFLNNGSVVVEKYMNANEEFLCPCLWKIITGMTFGKQR